MKCLAGPDLFPTNHLGSAIISCAAAHTTRASVLRKQRQVLRTSGQILAQACSSGERLEVRNLNASLGSFRRVSLAIREFPDLFSRTRTKVIHTGRGDQQLGALRSARTRGNIHQRSVISTFLPIRKRVFLRSRTGLYRQPLSRMRPGDCL